VLKDERSHKLLVLTFRRVVCYVYVRYVTVVVKLVEWSDSHAAILAPGEKPPVPILWDAGWAP
jgi:hypothetical protein